MRAARPALILLAGCLLLVGLGTSRILDSRAPADVGDLPASPDLAEPPSARPPPPAASGRPGAPGLSSDPSAATTPEPAAAPQRLLIPSLGVDAPLDPVGVEPATGEMEIPEDVTAVGWYRFGPAPGESGSAVLAGHVDSRTQGVGVLHRLREVAVGATIEIVAEDGSTTLWEVTGLRQHPKEELPAEDLFRRDGPPTLAVITCGGSFDRSVGRYDDNVVAYAVPAGPPDR